jgi:hypothetical protein
MKSKEEIEQLAFLQYPRLINDPYNPMEDDNTYERQIWIDAYTQCQEDMTDKKYTEEDVRNAFNAGDAWGRADYVGNNQPFPDEDEFINSLNKQ